jgi:DNA-directed RNA polymerase specialized sigma subunit
LESLTEIEREIIKNRYFEGLNFYDVAAIVGYSYHWVKKLNKKALVKINDVLRHY